MRARFVIVLLLAAALHPVATRLGAAEGPSPTSSDDAAAWIERLKLDEYDARAEAAEKLAALGEAARPALESALKSDDFETRLTASWLLARLAHSGVRIMAFDRAGKPLESADGTLSIYDNSTMYQITTRAPTPLKFGADGIAELSNLRPGTGNMSIQWQKCWVVGEPSYYGPSASAVSAYLGNRTTPFLFSMTRGGTVKTGIRDTDGKTLKEGEVALYAAAIFNPEYLDNRSAEYQPMRPIISASPDAAGNITLDGVNDGVYVCVVSGIKSPSVVGPTIRVREGQATLVPPIAVVPNLYGKFTITLSGALDPALALDPEQAQLIQIVRNNGKLPAKMQPDEPTKMEAERAKEPGPLKNLKLAVEDDFIFDGPDAETRTRHGIAERARSTRYRHAVLFDTDDKGKLTLENLRPGKHKIRIKTDIFAPVTFVVDIPASGTFDAGIVPLDNGGSVVLKAQTYDGKPVADLFAFAFLEEENAAVEFPEVVNFIRGTATWEEARSYITYPRQITGRRMYDNSEREKLALKNLAPGKYTIVVSRQTMTRTQQVFLLCGVTVEADKTVTAPELKFVAPPVTPRSVNDGLYLKGKVVGTTGEALARSTIYYQTNNSSTGTSLSSDGSFQIHIGNMGMGLGGMIHVKVPGYKQADYDCSAPGVDANNIEIKLTRLTYGSLKLKVVDEAGRPLAGACIDPAPFTNNNNYYYYNRRNKNLKKSTDARGEAAFSGLSTGMRRILIAKDGYYLVDPVRVTILADAETLVTVMLRTGLSLSGKLSAPGGDGGTALNHAVASLRRKSDGIVFNGSVNAAGEFSIASLTPDKYVLTAAAPLLAARAEREIDLLAESKAGIALELIPKGGFAVKLDKTLAGRSATLCENEAVEKTMARRTLPISAALYMGGSGSSGGIDADGKVEFWNVKPGTYRLQVSSDARITDYYNDSADTGRFLRRIDCSRLSEPFEIKAPKSFAELTLDGAVPIDIPDASASAVGKFVFRKSPEEAGARYNPYMQITNYLCVKGERCSGFINQYTRRTSSGTTTSSKLQVIGTLPQFLAPYSNNGQTLIQGLVPGKYTISTYNIVYDQMRNSQEMTEEIAVAQFEVKAGERKDLGPIVVEPSKTVVKTVAARRGGMIDNDAPTEEDLEPAFEP